MQCIDAIYIHVFSLQYGTASHFAAMVMVVIVVRVVMVWERPTVVTMVMVWVGKGRRVVTMVTVVTMVMVVMVVKQVLSFVVHDVGLMPQVSSSTKVTMLSFLCVCVCVCVRERERERERERACESKCMQTCIV